MTQQTPTGTNAAVAPPPSPEGVRPLLSVRHLKTYYFTDEGIVKSVDDASFDVHPGQTLGIVGESGCGKSVTARSILRIVERPGRIVSGEMVWRGSRGSLGGRDPVDADESAANSRTTVIESETDLAKLEPNGKRIRAIRGAGIALVFQEPMTSFSPVHTIGNQIVEAIRLHRGVAPREAKALAIDLLRGVGISRPEQRIDEYPFQLSGGLRQRAMIAMALACDPELLVADEPTTALDVTTQAQILDLLRQLQDQKHMAIMLITHNLGVVAEMAQEVVVMYLGRVVEKGTVDAIFYAPKHPYTRALLSSIPSIDAPARVPLPTISGSIPHAFNRPSGCPFHPRCESFMAGTCESYEPELLPVEDGHDVSCFLYHEPVAGQAAG